MVFTESKKRNRLSKKDFIKYQFLTICFLTKLNFSDNELNCLVELSLQENTNLVDFCKEMEDLKIFNSSQTVRNCIDKATKANLVIKEGKKRIKIYINPLLKVYTKGNVILDYKFLLDETL